MELDWNHRQVSEYSANSLSGGAGTSRVPPSDHTAGRQLCLWALGYPSAPVLPLQQTPQNSAVQRERERGWALFTEARDLEERGTIYPEIWKLLGSRQGRGCVLSLSAPSAMSPHHSKGTSALSPIGLASVTGRGDRKPIPRTDLLSLSGAVTDLGVPEKLHSLLL